jgi:transposase-like protein
MDMRFPEGMAKCDSEQCEGAIRKHHRVTGRTAFACDYCGTHLYPLAGTIFEKSTTPLSLWFYAMYLMGSTRCGVSAKQIQRETGVTYKTAWRMFRQIRTLMAEDIRLEGSSVEMDETYVGGVRKYGSGRLMRGDKKKMPVFGMAERGGKIKAFATPNVKSGTLLPIIRDYVLPQSIIFTDERNVYDGIKTMKNGYRHRRIKHKARVYVSGQVHTNTIEGFWSLVKRGLGGVYHSVSEKHLQSYLNEYSFRYNRRETGNLIFFAILARVAELASQPPVEAAVQNQTV